MKPDLAAAGPGRITERAGRGAAPGGEEYDPLLAARIKGQAVRTGLFQLIGSQVPADRAYSTLSRPGRG